jgi:hypothetical protein
MVEGRGVSPPQAVSLEGRVVARTANAQAFHDPTRRQPSRLATNDRACANPEPLSDLRRRPSVKMLLLPPSTALGPLVLPSRPSA